MTNAWISAREGRGDQQELQHRGLLQVARHPLAPPEDQAEHRRHGRDGEGEDEAKWPSSMLTSFHLAVQHVGFGLLIDVASGFCHSPRFLSSSTTSRGM